MPKYTADAAEISQLRGDAKALAGNLGPGERALSMVQEQLNASLIGKDYRVFLYKCGLLGGAACRGCRGGGRRRRAHPAAARPRRSRSRAARVLPPAPPSAIADLSLHWPAAHDSRGLRPEETVPINRRSR